MAHGTGSYPVIVRAGARNDLAALIAEQAPGARVAVIGDATAIAHLGNPLSDAQLFTFTAGEANKTRETWGALTDKLLSLRFDRASVIVAFGGGVASDLAGFVAATFLRGVPWIAVPTTTLAMLDAAVGGKTGVDTPTGKNLVGAFHPPRAVLCDPWFLRTLPEPAFREGLAEAIKHAATLDIGFAEWLLSHVDAIHARDDATLEELIHLSLELKAGVVSQDELEGDRRAVLNAGHTVAHALERATDYRLAHGEAVAIGLVIETRVAERAGIAAPGTTARVVQLTERLGLPTTIPAGLDHARILDAMHADKKNRDGVVHASLLRAFGSVAHEGDRWTMPLDLNVAREILSQ